MDKEYDVTFINKVFNLSNVDKLLWYEMNKMLQDMLLENKQLRCGEASCYVCNFTLRLDAGH